MERGWGARGLLRPLWERYPGGAKALAAAVGSSTQSLYGINGGSRPLGADLARRLADELGISVLELGAPESDGQRGLALVDRLEELEATLLETIEGQLEVREVLRALDQRLVVLEAEQQRRQGGSATPRVENGT